MHIDGITDSEEYSLVISVLEPEKAPGVDVVSVLWHYCSYLYLLLFPEA